MITNKKEFLYPITIDRLADPSFEYATNYLVKLTQEEIIRMDDRAVMAELNTIDDNITANFMEIQDSRSFDLVFGLIKGFQNSLSYKPMKFLQELMDKVSRWVTQAIKTINGLNQIQDLIQVRSSLKMILCLAFYLVKTSTQIKKEKDVLEKVNDLAIRKKKKKQVVNTSLSQKAQKFQWSLIIIVAKSLNQVNFAKLWKQQQTEENLFVFFVNMGFHLMISTMTQDDSMRKLVQNMFNKVLSLKHSLMKKIKKDTLKHVMQSQPGCQIIVQYFLKSDSLQTQNLFRQIILQSLSIVKQNKNANADNQQMKNLSIFYNKLSSKYSQIIMNNIQYFEMLYDSECYFLRNSLTTMVYYIIQKLLKQPTQDNKKAKENLVMLLLDRVYDKNVHCRSHTLNTLGAMIEQNILDKRLIKQVYKKAIQRMNDQGVNPRKKAISLTFQCTKAFFFLLKTTSSEKLMKIGQVKRQIQMTQTNLQSLQTMQQDLQKQIIQIKDQSEGEFIIDDLRLNESKIRQNELLLDHYKIYLEVLEIIQTILPIFQNLMSSSTTSDVTETIKLVVFLKQSEIQNIDTVLQQVWRLIFHYDQQVSNQVFNSFILLHIENYQSRAQNLIKLFTTSNAKDILCFQKIINLFLSKYKQKSLLDQTFVNKVWQRFKDIINKKGRQNQQVIKERRAISKLLQSVFQNDSKLIKSSHTMFVLSYVEEHLINKELLPDSNILIFFFNLMKIAKNEMDWNLRQHFILQVIPLVCDDKHFPLHIWCNVLEAMMQVGLIINPHPESFIKCILKKLSDHAIASKKAVSQGRLSEELMVNSMLRFYFFLGQMVGKLSQVSHILADTVRQATMAGVNQARRKGHTLASDAKEDKDRNEIMDWTNSQVISIQQEGDGIIRQLQGKSQKLINHSLLQNWISQTIECIKRIMKNGPDGSAIQKICVINFGKLMCNKLFATQNVKYLIYLMTKCPDQSLKVNSIISFADAISQNSSSLSSYSDSLFECILDNSRKVQLIALDTIWYLVMNNIMLFENQILYVAMVFETQTDQIKDYCKKFLLQQNKRNQSFLLGKIPQVLSQLSDEGKIFGKRKVTLKTYQSYAKQILPQIEKGKDKGMVETVTTSLVQIISNSLTPLLTKNACLSLSLLTHNEKSIIKILEGHTFIIAKVKDEDCVGYFRDLVAKLRRNRGQSKDIIDEFEAKFVQHSQFTFKRKQVAPQTFSAGVKGGKSNTTKRQPKKKSQKKKGKMQSEQQQQIVVINESQNQNNQEYQVQRGKRKDNKQPIQVQSSDEVIQVRRASRRNRANEDSQNDD